MMEKDGFAIYGIVVVSILFLMFAHCRLQKYEKSLVLTIISQMG